MNYQEMQNRFLPNNWVVNSNNGTSIVAKNQITGEVFIGTTIAFNTLMKTVRPTTDEMVADYDNLGNFIGIKTGSKSLTLVPGGGNILSIAAPDGTDVGDVLSALPATGWSVSGYQWTRDGVGISGQISSTYTLTLADEGALIGCRAGSPVYSALVQIPAGTYPPGYLSLDGAALRLDGSVLSLA